MKERLDILWVAIPLLILTVCMAQDNLPKFFTRKYWRNLFRHSVNKQIAYLDKEEQRLLKKIKQYENKHKQNLKE